MKMTSKEFMEWLGLKVGDRVAFKYGIDKVIFKVNENELEYENGTLPLFNLLNREIEILPQPKRVGDLKCGECSCSTCPLRAIGCRNVVTSTTSTLYYILDKYFKEYKDQEIYDLLKARLDKEVKE